MEIGLIDYIATWVYNSAPPLVLLVVGCLGSLVVLGSAIILATPGKDDDAWLSKQYAKPILGTVLNAITAFSFVKKEEKKLGLSNKPKA